jgi:hypothetical protein
MGVFGRALVLGFLVVVCAPRGLSATPLVNGTGGLSCGDLAPITPDERCGLFSISSGDELTVDFSLYEDVALFQFHLDGDTILSVTTDPFWEDLSGPYFGIYDSDTLDLATYLDPDGSGAFLPALFSSLDPTDPNSAPVILGEGDYVLALVGPFNLLHESLATGFDADGFDATECASDASGCTFALAFNAQPVPEPGTLTLMAGGAIAGLIQRRRSKKRNRSESVSR